METIINYLGYLILPLLLYALSKKIISKSKYRYKSLISLAITSLIVFVISKIYLEFLTEKIDVRYFDFLFYTLGIYSLFITPICIVILGVLILKNKLSKKQDTI